jgi:hypothetical protein
LDKNEIAALLESLCERPLAGDQEGPPPAIAAGASRIASADAVSTGQGGSQNAAELAAILSGTASEAECRAFHEAAMTSGGSRLEAQSALAFIEGIEQAPLAAPAHLVEQVLASAGARSRATPGIWSGFRSRLAGSLISRRGGQAVAACAVMLTAAGLSWSLIRQPAEFAPAGPIVPAATTPKEAQPISAIAPPPAVVPVAVPAPAPAEPTPPVPMPAAPAPAAVQALADPCTPRSAAKSEAQAASDVKFRVTKPEPKQPPKTASLDAPDPGCADPGSRLVVNPAAEGAAGRNQKGDRGPVHADRPAAQVGRADRGPAAAAASAPASAPSAGAARPASPALRPSAVQQSR